MEILIGCKACNYFLPTEQSPPGSFICPSKTRHFQVRGQQYEERISASEAYLTLWKVLAREKKTSSHNIRPVDRFLDKKELLGSWRSRSNFSCEQRLVCFQIRWRRRSKVPMSVGTSIDWMDACCSRQRMTDVIWKTLATLAVGSRTADSTRKRSLLRCWDRRMSMDRTEGHWLADRRYWSLLPLLDSLVAVVLR